MFAGDERDPESASPGSGNPDAYCSRSRCTATGTGANEACLLALEPLVKGLVANTVSSPRASSIRGGAPERIDITVLESPGTARSITDAIAAALDRDPSIQVGCSSSATRNAPACAPVRGDRAASASSAVAWFAADAISSAYAVPIDVDASQIDLVPLSSRSDHAARLGIVLTLRSRSRCSPPRASRAATTSI